jgi:hypothetical protein
MSKDLVDKLNRLLKEDSDFSKKFSDVFKTDVKVVIQVLDTEKVDQSARDSCHCYPYLCGMGCFSATRKGYVVG